MKCFCTRVVLIQFVDVDKMAGSMAAVGRRYKHEGPSCLQGRGVSGNGSIAQEVAVDWL